LKEFTRYFLQAETKGQLIFTTHESYLLDLENFRQDEIWFVEKDDFGNTKMYPLSEFMPRYDFDIRKGYLNGRFGAIPFLGDFSKKIGAINKERLSEIPVYLLSLRKEQKEKKNILNC